MASNSSRDEDVRLLSQLVGRQLRRARIRRDLTEAALAKKIGVSTDQIIGYEYGDEPLDLERLAGLAAALEVPLAQLIGGVLEPEVEALDEEERRDAIRLLRSFNLIADERIRKSFVEWIEAIATSTGKSAPAAPAGNPGTAGAASADRPDPAASAGKPDAAAPGGKDPPGRRRK